MKIAALCSCMVALGWASLAAVQSPVTPPPVDSRSAIKPGSRAGEYNVIVEGCVQGTRLDPLVGVRDRAAEYLGVSKWTLTGSPEVMRQIRTQFDRHHVEVTGVVVPPKSLRPRDDEAESWRLPDGTRVTVGSSRRTTDEFVPEVEGDATFARIDVKSVRVLNERCG